MSLAQRNSDRKRPRVIGIIPARRAATRLPDKPLLDIVGKPMIQRVWERVQAADCLTEVLVATPDEAIRDVVEGFGGRAVMTSDRHRSGTDRIAEVAAGLHAEIIVNIQGDEPLIEADAIERAIEPMVSDNSLPMASLMCPCPTEELDNPSTVKVVCNLRSEALYFSRARLPFSRYDGSEHVMQHVGLYVYRRDFLLVFAQLPPTPLEQAESLEQLRALEHGYRIRMIRIPHAPLSVDTEEDLARIRTIYALGEDR